MTHTPEDILGALVAHSQKLDFGRPDPIIMAARDEKVGKAKPNNWRLLGRSVDEHVEIWPATRSADGKQTHRASRYSIAETAADALVGMYERNWYALQVAIGIGETVRPILSSRLLRIAYRTKESERIWPDSIRRRKLPTGHTPASDYVPDLVELAIQHLEDPWAFRHHVDRAAWFRVSEAQWHAKVRRPFDQVAVHIWSWYYAGIGHIQHRIIRRAQPER